MEAHIGPGKPQPVHELRDSAQALRFLRQSLWLERTRAPRPAGVSLTLGWALELAAAGEPLPPLGFLADVGWLALGTGSLDGAREAVPGWPPGLVRAYEDCVLGKLAVDASFERGADALRRYQGRERARALVFLLQELRGRAGFGGALINPAVIKGLNDPEQLLQLGWQDLHQEGPLPVLLALTEELNTQVRAAADALGPEALFELEHGMALVPFGQRVALRQTLHLATQFETALPVQAPRGLPRRREAATQLVAEDAYPVGGFASLSTRGSIESLLHSQLAYMDPADRPDLFDLKFLRDELLYYSRDENQFLRRRQAFLFVFFPDLVETRVKDPGLATQRVLAALALVVTAIRRLTAWLHADALHFELVFVTDKRTVPLDAELALAQMIFRDQLANRTVTVTCRAPDELAQHCENLAARSQTACLLVSAGQSKVAVEQAQVSRLDLGRPIPGLETPGEEVCVATDDPAEAWDAIVKLVLRRLANVEL